MINKTGHDKNTFLCNCSNYGIINGANRKHCKNIIYKKAKEVRTKARTIIFEIEKMHENEDIFVSCAT